MVFGMGKDCGGGLLFNGGYGSRFMLLMVFCVCVVSLLVVDFGLILVIGFSIVVSWMDNVWYIGVVGCIVVLVSCC